MRGAPFLQTTWQYPVDVYPPLPAHPCHRAGVGMRGGGVDGTAQWEYQWGVQGCETGRLDSWASQNAHWLRAACVCTPAEAAQGRTHTSSLLWKLAGMCSATSAAGLCVGACAVTCPPSDTPVSAGCLHPTANGKGPFLSKTLHFCEVLCLLSVGLLANSQIVLGMP